MPATTEGIKQNFYEYLDAALQFVPPSPKDKDVRARLASIGIWPGKTFDFKALSPEHKAAVLLGMKEGDDKVTKWLASGMKNINGWNVGAFFGDGGLYGNDSVEAMYPYTSTDGIGQELDASKHNFTITFPAAQLPPVKAFWSVTMYDGKSQLLIKNPINRYLINSPMLPSMKKNPDGSLTLYIQKAHPGRRRKRTGCQPQRHRLLGAAPLLA